MVGETQRPALLMIGDVGYASIIRNLLDRGAPERFGLVQAADWTEGHGILESRPISLILFDISRLGTRGLAAIRELFTTELPVPVVILAGENDTELAGHAVALGAEDYISTRELDPSFLVRTVRHAMERHQLVKQQASLKKQLRLKDQSLSHVSHELRSPLSSIHQFTTILLDELEGPINASQRESLETILRNTGRLRTLIEDLVEATRAGTGNLRVDPTYVNVVELVEESVANVQSAAQAAGMVLTAHIDGSLPAVFADAHRIFQVLSNLVDNAMKYTPAEGSIHVTVRRSPNEPKFIRVSVSDSGSGISKDHLPFVFDRLYRCAQDSGQTSEGLGLGLYISKEIVLRHGGRMWVESEAGQSTTFHFTLPVVDWEELFMPLRASSLESHPLQVVTIRLQANSPAASERWMDLRRHAKWLVRGMLAQSQDVLIPIAGARHGSETILVVTRADADAMTALMKKIRTRLATDERIGPALQISIRSREVMPGGRRIWTTSLEEEIREGGLPVPGLLEQAKWYANG